MAPFPDDEPADYDSVLDRYTRLLAALSTHGVAPPAVVGESDPDLESVFAAAPDTSRRFDFVLAAIAQDRYALAEVEVAPAA